MRLIFIFFLGIIVFHNVYSQGKYGGFGVNNWVMHYDDSGELQYSADLPQVLLGGKILVGGVFSEYFFGECEYSRSLSRGKIDSFGNHISAQAQMAGCFVLGENRVLSKIPLYLGGGLGASWARFDYQLASQRVGAEFLGPSVHRAELKPAMRLHCAWKMRATTLRVSGHFQEAHLDGFSRDMSVFFLDLLFAF